MKRQQSSMAIFAVPLILAVVSVIGLVAALAGDGLNDLLSWIALAAPVIAVVWAMRVRRL